MNRITLQIDGMRCAMCEAHVADAIRRALPKAKKVKASHGKGEATFLIENEENVDVVETKLEELGYHVLDKRCEEARKGLFGYK